MPKFRKEIIRAGTYWAQGPSPVTVTKNNLSAYVSNFSKMKKHGLSVPVLWEHPDLMDPEGDPRDDRAKMAKNTIGFLEDVIQQGDRVYGIFDAPIPEDAQRLKAHKFVSPKISKSWQDGSGRSWEDIIAHVAVTPIPVQSTQDPFEELPEPQTVNSWAASAVVLSLANLSLAGEWTKYEGPKGGSGWRNTQTGQVVYQDEKPGGTNPRSKEEDYLRQKKDENDKFIQEARKKLGPELSKKIQRQSPGNGGEIQLTPEEVGKVLTDGVVGFISGGRNPNNAEDMKLTDQEVEARDEKLKSDLVKRGYRFVRVNGKYGEEEPSYMVMIPEATKKELVELGESYNQDSILYSRANQNELIFTTGENKGKAFKGMGWDAVPDAEDFYTEYTTASGEKIKFVLGLNFDAMDQSKLFSRLKENTMAEDMKKKKDYEDEDVEVEVNIDADEDMEDVQLDEDSLAEDAMDDISTGYPNLSEVIDTLSTFSPPIVVPQDGTDESNFIERLWVAVTAAKAAATGEVESLDNTMTPEEDEYAMEEVPQVAALSKSLANEKKKSAVMLSHITQAQKQSLKDRITALYRKMVIGKDIKEQWLKQAENFQLSFGSDGLKKSVLELRIEDHEKLRPGAALEANDPRLATLLSHTVKEVPLPGDLAPDEQSDSYIVDQFFKLTGGRG